MSSVHHMFNHKRNNVTINQATAGFNEQIIGTNIIIKQEHTENVNETKKADSELRSKQDHRRRLNHFITFLQEEYPEYYRIGTRELSSEEINDEMNFYFPSQRNWTGRDLIYSGINFQIVLAFLGHTKYQNDGVLKLHTDRRKVHNAIQFGA